MNMFGRFLQREKRFIKSERVAFLVLPLILVPPLLAMIAVISEVILGVVQGRVFVAIVIYAHHNKGK